MDPEVFLLRAIREKYPYRVIKDIVERIDNINYGNCTISNPLLLLCNQGNCFNFHPSSNKILILLISKGIDVNTIDKNTGNTSLYLLSTSGNPICLKYIKTLLKYGATINQSNWKMKRCNVLALDLINSYILYGSFEGNSLIDLIRQNRAMNQFCVAIKYLNLNKKQQFQGLLYLLGRESDNNYIDMIRALSSVGITVQNVADEFRDFIENNSVTIKFVVRIIELGFYFDYTKLKISDKGLESDVIKVISYLTNKVSQLTNDTDNIEKLINNLIK